MRKHISLWAIFVIIIMGITFTATKTAEAATTFTVNSTADDSDNNTGDGVCDTAANECTLRAAIEESNALAGTDTIEFNIPGAGVHTISPATGYPIVDDTVIIDGYSQPGAAVNTAVSPLPLNGTLLIELDGSSIPGNSATGIALAGDADNSVIRGLVINRFPYNGIDMGAPGVHVEGNYIGSDPTGMLDRGNHWAGVNHFASGTGATIGGLTPDKRNLIVANDSSGGYPATGWVIQGNYVGIAADGVTALGNSEANGSGAFSIDVTEDVLVGGTATGSANVISGNLNHGLAPDNNERLTIQGNFIGTDYTGLVAVPNAGPGINLNNSVDTIIGGNSVAARNIISGNGSDGLCIGNNQNLTVQGNFIGVNASNTAALPNVANGLSTACGDANTGIIGGDGSNEQNVIAYNGANGIYIIGTNDRLALVSNAIFSNIYAGIALSNFIPTPNDAGDGDTGPNTRLNFPIVSDIEESGGNTTFTFDVDVPAGDYRIEFYSNNAAEPTFGEGQFLLGYMDYTSPGTGADTVVHTITGTTGVTNAAMTITRKDNSTASGYSYTSEYGGLILPVGDLNMTKSVVSANNVVAGGQIQYEFVFSNDGETTIDLAAFVGTTPGTDTLLIDFSPPDLDYVSIDSSDITCAPQGEGSASMFGPALGNHSDHELVFCGWTGGSYILNPGDTYTAVMTFDIVDGSDLVFTNYAFMGVTPVPGDPDGAAMGTAFGLGGDLIDYFLGAPMGNFSSAEFPVAVDPPTSTTTVVSAPGVDAGSGTLPATGADLVLVGIIASALLGTGCSLRILRKSQI